MAVVLPVNANWHAVSLYRLAHLLYRLKIPLMPHVLYWLNYVLFGVEIHYKAKIGRKLTLGHTSGIVIGKDVVIGDYCTIYSGAVLGARRHKSGMPKLGNHVLVGTGAKILGNIQIGDNVKIGAGTILMRNVPDRSTVYATQNVEIHSNQ